MRRPRRPLIFGFADCAVNAIPSRRDIPARSGISPTDMARWPMALWRDDLSLKDMHLSSSAAPTCRVRIRRPRHRDSTGSSNGAPLAPRKGDEMATGFKRTLSGVNEKPTQVPGGGLRPLLGRPQPGGKKGLLLSRHDPSERGAPTARHGGWAAGRGRLT